MQSASIIFVFVAIASSSIANSQSAGRNSSPAEVAAARDAHLAEVARITNERLTALAAARARATTPVPAILPLPALPAPPVAPSPLFAPDVAAATAAHLAEVSRQIQAFLAARAAVLARPPRLVENFERRPYALSYSVDDAITGDRKSASEARVGEVTRGSYSLVQPDGVLRTVNYVVTPTGGFQAQVLNDGVPVFGSAPPAIVPPVAPSVEVVLLPQAQAPLEDPAVVAAREEHLAEVARITDERMAALSAALANASPAVPAN